MRSAPLWTILAAVGCASGAPERPSETARPVMYEDLVGLALEASGYPPEARAAARDRFEAFAFPWIRDLAGIRFPEKKAKALLARLHGPGGPLKTYDARATSLRDVLEHGRYNCVSASVLYNLAAEKIGVDALGELLPTHARTLVRIPGVSAPLVVETTSPVGFDPSAELSQRILAQVAAGFSPADARVLVPEGGVRVDTRVLVAAMLVNRASLEQEKGDLTMAASLFQQGEALAPDAQMRAVLRDQRAALVSQLAAADALSEDPSRLERSFRTLLGMAEIEPEDEEIRRIVARNLRVVVERSVSALAAAGREDEALERLRELAQIRALKSERPALGAFTFGEVARARSARGQAESALSAMDAALAERLGERETALRATLEHNHWLLLRRALSNAAKAGDEAAVEKLIRRAESAAGRGEGRRAELEQDRRVVLSLLGQKKLEAKDARGAVEILREGVRRFTGDPTLRHNLLVALQRLWVPLVDAGRCEEAEPLWDEASRAEPGSSLPSEGRARCYLIRANQRLDARDFAEAASWLGLAAKERPTMKTVDESLGALLLRWARGTDAACPKIVETARELLGRAPTPAARASAEAALAECRG